MSRQRRLDCSGMPDPVYLDHAATTPVSAEVLEAMRPFFGARFGNPSSVHHWGREARTALDEAHERVARCIGAAADEVIFTSCGTEADNMAVLGVWRARRDEGRTVVLTTPTEHKAVLAAAHQVMREGGEERLVDMLPTGLIDDASYDSKADERVAVCSVMWVNNEIGVIQDIATLAARAKSRGIIFHTDAVQAFGKIDVDARHTPFDMLSLSGHKIGAPKGIGALYVRRGTPIEPLMFGGAQDRGRRPGTENVAMAVGLARAAELVIAEREHEWKKLEALRTRLEAALLEHIPDAVIHGRGAPRAPHIMNISVPGTDSESLLMALDLRGIGCSAGSACQSGSITPSHVLAAIGVAPDLASSAIRMSLGSLNSDACITRVVDIFPMLVDKARRLAAT